MTNGYKKYNLECPDKLWKEFKETLKKDEVINKIVLDMIEKRIREYNKKWISP